MITFIKKFNIPFLWAGIIAFMASPHIALAVCRWEVYGSCNFDSFVKWTIASIFKPVIPVLVSLTVVYFLWGTAQYIMNTEDLTKRTEGRKRMIWGIVGLSVMMSFWAFANMVKGTFF